MGKVGMFVSMWFLAIGRGVGKILQLSFQRSTGKWERMCRIIDGPTSEICCIYCVVLGAYCTAPAMDWTYLCWILLILAYFTVQYKLNILLSEGFNLWWHFILLVCLKFVPLRKIDGELSWEDTMHLAFITQIHMVAILLIMQK